MANASRKIKCMSVVTQESAWVWCKNRMFDKQLSVYSFAVPAKLNPLPMCAAGTTFSGVTPCRIPVLTGFTGVCNCKFEFITG